MGKLASMDRSVVIRLVVFASAFVALWALYTWLWGLKPTFGAALAEKYSDLDQAALERIETLSDRAFTLAVGLIGALGAVFLGLSKGPKLKGPRAYAIALSVLLALASTMAGLVARFHLIYMMAHKWSPYLTAEPIQTPFGLQYFLLFLSIAAIGWFIVDDVLRS